MPSFGPGRAAGRAFSLAVVLGLALSVGAASATPTEPLAADVSDHLVGVTAGFTGRDLLLYGATGGEGDVVVVVSGPRRPVGVRRKERWMGIWVNGPPTVVPDVPTYYAVVSNRPLDEIVSAEERRRQGIGIDALAHTAAQSADPGAVAALIGVKQDEGLYSETVGLSFLGGSLFRGTLHFPVNVPLGAFRSKVYLVDQGAVVRAQEMSVEIRRAGLSHLLFSFADDHRVLYGILTVLGSALVGWLTNLVFKKVRWS